MGQVLTFGCQVKGENSKAGQRLIKIEDLSPTAKSVGGMTLSEARERLQSKGGKARVGGGAKLVFKSILSLQRP